MWELRNNTPFAASVGFYRDHRDLGFWGVWVKAAFELRDERPPLFLADGAVLHHAPLFDADNTELLLADTDLTPAKEQIDLLLSATASQSSDSEFRQILFRLGTWQKRLVLAPPLRWDWRGRAVRDRNGRPAVLPLDGRISFGGRDHPENPLGTGMPGEGQDVDLPVLLYADQAVLRRGQPVRPALIGPIPRRWPTRQRLAGTYDEGWQITRAPCLPRDFQPKHWQAAPDDQQLGRPLAQAAMFEAGGLLGTGPADRPSRFPLTDLDLSCATRIGGRWMVAEAALQTIRIDVIDRRLDLIYLATWKMPRAAADVEVDLTRLSLNSTAGFRVRPEDAHLFSVSAYEAVS